MPFEFATATRIVFGLGSIREAIPAAKAMGQRALLVTGNSSERSANFQKTLEAAGLVCFPLRIAGEPTVDSIRQGTREARDAKCDFVISFGGGSAIDAGKAIAALLTNGPEPLDYLEVIGKGRTLSSPSAPFIAIPTTAGTGSEVTRNAVLASPEHGVKASLRSPLMLPRLAVIDPELTFSLPPAATASTGLDALTQVIEPYVSVRANPMTDAFCIEGMKRAARSLQRAYNNGQDQQARTDMALTSLFGGLALANAGLGAVHGFAAAIGGMFPAPHGAVCAALLPHTTRVNIRALQARAADSEALRRYGFVAQWLTGNPKATAKDGVTWLTETCQALQIPRLAAYGILERDSTNLIEKAAKASSMKGNPIQLVENELHEILGSAL